MTPTRREILEMVARGDVSPEEADALLRGLDSNGEPPPASTATIDSVKVSAGFGALVIEGDESITEAEIEGPHSATVDGDTLVIHADIDPLSPGVFEINLGGRHRRRAKHIGLGRHRGASLRIRMNPNLALSVRLDAGPMAIRGIHGSIRARAAAGPITIEESTGPLDVSVNAGAIRVVGKLTHGDSRLRSDAGAVRVELDPASSVRIVADAALGRVLLPDEERPGTQRRFGSRSEATIGAGDATLRVETAMGSIHVTTN